MEWVWIILIFIGLLLFFVLLGMPVAFSFLVTNLITASFVFGGAAGINQLILNIYDSVSVFTLAPIPLFILLGQLLFRSGLATQALDALSNLLGKLPGRLSVLSVLAGTLFATLSGSNIANTSMLGSLLVPEMRKRGYHVAMTTGPIMAAGTLAMIIPPSNVAILMGSVGNISIGGLFIGGIIPGVLLATCFISYIVIVSLLNPSWAPTYEVARQSSWIGSIIFFVRVVLPLAFIIFVVLGLIFLGLATPTESAALGVLGAFALTIIYRRINGRMLLETMKGTLRTTGMILLIFASASGFSQLLSFSGATRQLISTVTGWDLSTLVIILLMLSIVLLMGTFLDQNSILLVTIPLFMPIVFALDLNPVWFGIMMLISLDLGNLTPPFGFSLFVMKGVAPEDVKMGDIYISALPFVLIGMAVVIMILMFPAIVLWLPGLGAL